TEQPRLILFRQRVEILVRVRHEPLIARPLTRLRRDMHAIAARMTQKTVIPPEPTPRQDRAPRTRRRIQHPHIPARKVRSIPGSRSHTPRIRHHATNDLRELVPRTPQRLSRHQPGTNRLLSANRGNIKRSLQIPATRRHARKRLRISKRDRQLILPRLDAHPAVSPQRRLCRANLRRRNRRGHSRKVTLPRFRNRVRGHLGPRRERKPKRVTLVRLDALIMPRRLRRNPLRRHPRPPPRSEEHTSELQSRENLVCSLLLE